MKAVRRSLLSNGVGAGELGATQALGIVGDNAVVWLAGGGQATCVGQQLLQAQGHPVQSALSGWCHILDPHGSCPACSCSDLVPLSMASQLVRTSVY